MKTHLHFQWILASQRDISGTFYRSQTPDNLCFLLKKRYLSLFCNKLVLIIYYNLQWYVDISVCLVRNIVFVAQSQSLYISRAENLPCDKCPSATFSVPQWTFQLGLKKRCCCDFSSLCKLCFPRYCILRKWLQKFYSAIICKGIMFCEKINYTNTLTFF